MCKSDQDCPRGQICVRGVCAATARRPPLRWLWSLLGLLLSACVTGASDKPADEQILITSGVGYSSKIGTAEGQEAPDSDFAADPQPKQDDGRAASFASTTSEVLAAAAQGQGGIYGKTRPILEQAECQARRVEAEQAVPGCAAEMFVAKCGRGDNFRPTECAACARLYMADDRLSDAGCPARTVYPSLRDR